MCWVISAMGLREGSLRYSSGAGSPLIRMRRPDGVSRVGEHLDVVDEGGLARPGGPDDARHVAHLQVEALHRFGLPDFRGLRGW